MQAKPLKHNDTAERVRALVEGALQTKGMSGRQASLQVVGHDGLIRDIRAGRLPGLDKLEALFDLLGLECYFGPQREVGPLPPSADPSDLANIPLHEAFLSAGAGAANTSEHIVGHLAFRHDWLRKVGVVPANAILARASGDSMQPCIWDGDVLLIDRSRIEPPGAPRKGVTSRRPPIFALLDDGEAKVKRIQLQEGGMAALISDNPDYPPQFTRIDTLKIIGKVMWWGHTNRD